jgi:hypothetical protein
VLAAEGIVLGKESTLLALARIGPRALTTRMEMGIDASGQV